MPQIIPIKDLRNTNEISRLCHAKKEPVFVTKQGYGDLVVMSVETYDMLIGIAETDAIIAAAGSRTQGRPVCLSGIPAIVCKELYDHIPH